MQTSNKKRVKRVKREVAHCTLKLNTKFKFNGVVYIKYAVKRGMTSDGTVVNFNDASLVEKID